MSRLWKRWCAASFAICLVGCGDRRPQAPATGTYGPPAAQASASIARAQPDLPATQPWTNDGLAAIQTELSPATLYHSKSKTLSFFANMMETGIGGPTFAAIETEQGPKIFKPGDEIAPSRLRESWFVVWWSGATNWTNWDSPWFLTLQRKPAKIRFDTNGLHFTFPVEAGYAALMPMYGYYKPLPLSLEKHPFYSLKEKKKRVLTWEWFKALPADPLSRARYWASALREFPVYCEDSFSIDRAHDSVTFRQSFRWLSWDDDWKTEHLKLAPVSPVLAHAVREGFPAEFNPKPFDMEILTPQGPYYGVQGVDSYEVTLPLLRYVNETLMPPTNFTGATAEITAVLEQLRQAARVQFASATKPANAQAAGWFARALPFMDDATRRNAATSLAKYFREDLRPPNRTAIDANAWDALWAYAHFSGDWELVRELWPAVKPRFTAPARTRWAGFASDGKSFPAEGAASALAFARLAWKTGDIDSYYFAVQMFARELTHLWLNERGAKYFHDNQPWHSMEQIEGEVFPNQLRAGLAGWQIDGPSYPKQATERQFTNRWESFTNPDLNLFLIQHFYNGAPRTAGTGRLRTQPERIIADCVMALRTNGPPHFERLIPGGPPSPFVAGLEREVPGPNPHLVQNIVTERQDKDSKLIAPTWPRVSWWGWKTPTGLSWNFGQVLDSTNAPATSESTALNWNTRVVTTHAAKDP